MDKISGQYSKFMSDIIDSGIWAELSSSAKTLYPILLKFSDQNFKCVWPSTGTLLKLSGFKSKKSIITAKKELSLAGLLHFKPGTGRTNSVYYFTFNFFKKNGTNEGYPFLHPRGGESFPSEVASDGTLGGQGFNPNHINITIHNNHTLNSSTVNDIDKKDLIKNYGEDVYNSSLRNLLKTGKKVNLEDINNECLNIINHSESDDSAQHIIDSWKQFLSWSRKHLTKSSTTIFENLKIDVDGASIYINENLSDFQKQIITKYFEENITPRIILLFKSNSTMKI